MSTPSLQSDVKLSLEGEGITIWHRRADRDVAHFIKAELPKILREVGANLDMTVPAHVEVVICVDLREVQLYSRGRIPTWSAAIAQPEKARILICRDRLTSGDRVELEKVLRHESAHILFGGLPKSLRQKIPLWFEEGVAQKFAGRLFVFEYDTLAARIDLWESLPLTDWEERFPESKEGAEIAYLYSEAIVRLMIRLWGSDVINDILSTLRRTDSFSEAVYRVTGHPVVWHEKRLHEEIASDRSIYVRALYGFFGSICFLGIIPLLFIGIYRVRKKRDLQFAQWESEETQ